MSEQTSTLEALNAMQRRLLTALCQAGGRRVGRALRNLLGDESTHIEIYDAGVLELKAATALLDGGGHDFVGVLFELSGKMSGRLSMVLPDRGAMLLADRLFAGALPVLSDDGQLTAEAASALVEVGNIVASAFLNALADAIRRSCIPSPPSLHHESEGALVDRIGAGERGSNVLAISFEALLANHQQPLTGQILFAPDAYFIEAILGPQPSRTRSADEASG